MKRTAKLLISILMLNLIISSAVFASESDDELLTDTEAEENNNDTTYDDSASSEGEAGMAAYDSSLLALEDDATTVTFTLDLGDTYSTEPYVVYFCEMESYQEYYVEFYASANYTTVVTMPVGVYYFTSGGPENDYMSIYTVTDPDYFTVYSGQNYVTITIRSRMETLSDTEDETDAEEEEIEIESSTEESSSAFNFPWYVYLIGGIILLVVGLGICYAMYKDAEKKRKDGTI